MERCEAPLPSSSYPSRLLLSPTFPGQPHPPPMMSTAAATATAGTPVCPPPVSRGGRRSGRCAVRAQAAAGGGDGAEQKSLEIMRKFSEQYARRSSTFFCSDKSVTAVVIKVKQCSWRYCKSNKAYLPATPTMGSLTTRINSEHLSAPAGITTTRPPRPRRGSGTAPASPCEKGRSAIACFSLRPTTILPERTRQSAWRRSRRRHPSTNNPVTPVLLERGYSQSVGRSSLSGPVYVVSL